MIEDRDRMETSLVKDAIWIGSVLGTGASGRWSNPKSGVTSWKLCIPWQLTSSYPINEDSHDCIVS